MSLPVSGSMPIARAIGPSLVPARPTIMPLSSNRKIWVPSVVVRPESTPGELTCREYVVEAPTESAPGLALTASKSAPLMVPSPIKIAGGSKLNGSGLSTSSPELESPALAPTVSSTTTDADKRNCSPSSIDLIAADTTGPSSSMVTVKVPVALSPFASRIVSVMETVRSSSRSANACVEALSTTNT